jgi:hypothetical protein
MMKWLRVITYTFVAILVVLVMASGGLVFLAIGAVIGLAVLGSMFFGMLGYLIKDLWDYSKNR